MEGTQTIGAPVAARIGRAIVGGFLGLGLSVVGSTVISTRDGSSAAWALGLTILVISAPFTVAIGGLIGAMTARRQMIDATGAPIPPRPLRDAHLGAILLGIVAGFVALVTLFVLFGAGLGMLSVFVADLMPGFQGTMILISLAMAVWGACSFAARVIRWTDPLLGRGAQSAVIEG